jgi:type 1 fimbriae regulatory protein FimB/type 1 fimbriae regulatory protein FimE
LAFTANGAVSLIGCASAIVRAAGRSGHAANALKCGPLRRHPDYKVSMLRQACGCALTNRGHATRALQVYLVHKNIQHTIRYTEWSPTRCKDFWRK